MLAHAKLESNPPRLDGQVAFVTGASRGLCRAFAGCHIADTDLPDQLLGHVEQTRQEELYVLRIHSLPVAELIPCLTTCR